LKKVRVEKTEKSLEISVFLVFLFRIDFDRYTWQGQKDSSIGSPTQSRALISALLRASVGRGSDSPPGCHPFPLPFESVMPTISKEIRTEHISVFGSYLAGAEGFEPTTRGFGDRRSTS
jgi:hypothetical protein